MYCRTQEWRVVTYPPAFAGSELFCIGRVRWPPALRARQVKAPASRTHEFWVSRPYITTTECLRQTPFYDLWPLRKAWMFWGTSPVALRARPSETWNTVSITLDMFSPRGTFSSWFSVSSPLTSLARTFPDSRVSPYGSAGDYRKVFMVLCWAFMTFLFRGKHLFNIVSVAMIKDSTGVIITCAGLPFLVLSSVHHPPSKHHGSIQSIVNWLMQLYSDKLNAARERAAKLSLTIPWSVIEQLSWNVSGLTPTNPNTSLGIAAHLRKTARTESTTPTPRKKLCMKAQLVGLWWSNHGGITR
jgi:hypothetical protein